MLPVHLLLVASPDPDSGRATPRYLGARDEIWVRAALDMFDAYVGRTVGERAAELPDRIRALAYAHGVAARAGRGIQHVLMRRFKVQVDARIEPSRARAITFEEAGRDEHFNRDAVLARAAARLSAGDEEVARALFADRAERRRILAPEAPLSAADVVEQYNLALVQGLLQRSEHVRVEIREHVRAVVRFAKLAGLLCTYSPAERGTALEVSGPLSILRHTLRDPLII